MSSGSVGTSMSGLAGYLHGEFVAVLGASRAPGTGYLLVNLALYILTINLMGLLPYVFTNSAHMVFALALTLPI